MHENHDLPELSPEDRAVLDALADAGFDADAAALTDEQRPRAEVLLRLLGLLEDYPVDVADDDGSLVDATVARIRRIERERDDRMRLPEPASAGRRGRLPIPDFMTVAAVLLIGASLAIPAMNILRQRSLETQCANGLRELAFAFDGYAADHGGELPVVRAGLAGGWSRLGSNMLNLGPLVEASYCELQHLHCPGHDSQPGPSYSYQWQDPEVRILWGAGPRSIILGDRNPLIDAIWTGDEATPATGSFNHGGRGQNVLASDGSAQWLQRTVIGRDDNIWLPKGFDALEDGARPHGPRDVFLAH